MTGERFSDRELAKLRADFEQHVAEGNERWDRLVRLVEQNTEATRSLADSVKGVVDLYEDVRAAARVGGSIQRFMLWLVKWGAVGTGLAAWLAWLLDLFPPSPPGT